MKGGGRVGAASSAGQLGLRPLAATRAPGVSVGMPYIVLILQAQKPCHRNPTHRHMSYLRRLASERTRLVFYSSHKRELASKL